MVASLMGMSVCCAARRVIMKISEKHVRSRCSTDGVYPLNKHLSNTFEVGQINTNTNKQKETASHAITSYKRQTRPQTP